MDKALVIMAAGMGSRFGEGIKQLTPVGPGGEVVMDYSIHDAIRAGFTQIVFILRRDILPVFRELVGDRLEEKVKPLGIRIDYAFQELDDLPEGLKPAEGRKKPWGTCQAVLSARDVLKTPFAVVNADDYYGQDAFRLIAEALEKTAPDDPASLIMVGYILKNTLSENGTVTRGICEAEDGCLRTLHETGKIQADPDTGRIVSDRGELTGDETVSMNLWGLTPAFMSGMNDAFAAFLKDPETDPLKGEFLLPIYIGSLLEKGEATVKVLRSHDKWFGMTYAQDIASTKEEIGKLVAKGVYSADLYSDLG